METRPGRRRLNSQKSKWAGWRKHSALLGLPLLLIGLLLYLALAEGGLSWPASLDFTGGTRLEYEIDEVSARREGYESSVELQSALERSQEIFLFRLREFDLSELIIKPIGNKRLVLEVPGTAGIATVKQKIGNAAQLNFRILLDVNKSITNEEYLQLPNDQKELYFNLESTNSFFEVSEPVFDALGVSYKGTEAIPNGSDFQRAGEAYINLKLTSAGSREFAAMTTKYVGHNLAISLDNIIVSAPRITSANIVYPSITGDFTLDEAKYLAGILRSGPLPVSLNLVSEMLVSSNLGKDNLQRGLLALSIGTSLILLILILVYADHLAMLATLIICIALECILLFILGQIGWLTLSLVSLSGLVVLLGISVDNLILVFEEFRSNQRNRDIAGRDLLNNLRNSFKAERTIIIMSNATTILALISLLFLEGPIKDLVTVIGTGTVVALVITVWFAPKLLSVDGLVVALEQYSSRRPLLEPKLKLHASSQYLFWVYMLVMATALALTLTKGVTLGLDLKGGVEIILATNEGVDTDALRTYASEYYGERVEVKRIRSNDLGLTTEFKYVVRAPSAEALSIGGVASGVDTEESVEEGTVPQTIAQGMVLGLKDHLGTSVEVVSVEQMGSTVIGLRFWTAMMTIVAGLFLLLLVVSIGYGGGYALPVLGAVMGDAVIVFGAISLFSVPLSIPVLGAILTVIGYSINDSIVLCGHVRRESKEAMEDYLDKFDDAVLSSIVDDPNEMASDYFGREVIDKLASRILITSFTTVVVSASLWIIGLGILQDFGLIITVGVIFGTLSSVALVAPRLESQHKNEMREMADRILEERVSVPQI